MRLIYAFVIAFQLRCLNQNLFEEGASASSLAAADGQVALHTERNRLKQHS